MHFSFPFSWMWLQMIIQRDRHLVNDHMEGPASCKLYPEGQASSCVKSVSEHIYSLSGVKHTTKKNHEKLTIRWWCGGWVNAFSQPDRKISRRNLYYMKNYISKKRWRSQDTVDFCLGDVDIWGSRS